MKQCQMCHLRLLGALTGMEADALREYQSKKITKNYREGDALFREGDDPEGIHCLFLGRIKLYKEGLEGRPQILRLAGPGDLLGYQAILAEESHAATAEALGEIQSCFIAKADFLSALRKSPRFNLMLLQRLSRELRAAEGLVSSLAQKPARARMAELLLALAEVHVPSAGRPSRISLPLSREEIAEMVGVAQETAIRLLSDFRKEGWIRLEERELTILDPKTLSELAAS